MVGKCWCRSVEYILYSVWFEVRRSVMNDMHCLSHNKRTVIMLHVREKQSIKGEKFMKFANDYLLLKYC